MRVFVTGSSSHFAAALLPKLCDYPRVEEVRGIDLRPPRFGHPKFHATRHDVRDPALARLIAGHDAVIHLAFVVLRGRMSERDMRDVNVRGSRHVFHAARRCGVRRLIHLSSAAVYGSGIDLTETAPYDPLPGFLYARHKAEIERMLEHEVPECVRLRPHAILGPHAQPLLRQLLHQPCYVSMPDPQPRLQCVHEEDVVQALLLALERDVTGPFNLAVADSFSFRDVIRARRRFSAPLPRSVARMGVRLAWRVSGWGGEPSWVDGLSSTLLLDCSRARKELGWQSAHNAASALESMYNDGAR